MQNSPNIGERSAKCVIATLKVSFPLQFWIFLPGFFFFFRKSMILSRGITVIFENAKKRIFKNDDTSNEKRRGTKIRGPE